MLIFSSNWKENKYEVFFWEKEKLVVIKIVKAVFIFYEKKIIIIFILKN